MRAQAALLDTECGEIQQDCADEKVITTDLNTTLTRLAEEKDQMRARLQQHMPLMSQVLATDGAGLKDLVLVLSIKHAELVGHRNVRQSVRMSQAYVDTNLELREKNSRMRREVEEMKRMLGDLRSER